MIGVSDEAWQAHAADLEARRPVVDFRFAKADPNGRVRHFSVSAKPIFDEHGAFHGYRGTGRDLTAQIEAERFPRQVVDSVPAVIAVRDTEMRHLLLNEYYARHLRTSPTEAVGADTGAFLGPERAAAVNARDRQAIESGVAMGPYEITMANAGGEDRHWLVQKVPLTSAEDKVVAVLTVGMDITALNQAKAELVLAQERLGASERCFRDFAEIGSDVTWEMDAELRITYVSDGIEQVTGVPAADYLGKRNIDLAAEDPRRPAAERLLEKRSVIRDFPMTRRHPDGRIVHLLYSAKPVFAADGAFMGYRGTIRDITAQREAELETDRLRKARDLAAAVDVAKTQFLANMSHELRTPLNAILGFAEILGGEMFGPLGAPPYRAYMCDIASSGRRLLEIINDLLDMSHIQLDEFVLEPEAVGVGALIAEGVAAAAARAAAERAAVTVMPVDPGWVIEVDRRAMAQVMTKLLSNAFKFTPPSGRIGVEFRQELGAAVSIVVTDTGCGIAPERLATLFEPFQNSGAERTRSGKGAGLGLWVDRALVEPHGGTLAVRSTPGEGTTVTVTLPAIRVRQRPALLAAG